MGRCSNNKYSGNHRGRGTGSGSGSGSSSSGSSPTSPLGMGGLESLFRLSLIIPLPNQPLGEGLPSPLPSPKGSAGGSLEVSTLHIGPKLAQNRLPKNRMFDFIA